MKKRITHAQYLQLKALRLAGKKQLDALNRLEAQAARILGDTGDTDWPMNFIWNQDDVDEMLDRLKIKRPDNSRLAARNS